MMKRLGARGLLSRSSSGTVRKRPAAKVTSNRFAAKATSRVAGKRSSSKTSAKGSTSKRITLDTSSKQIPKRPSTKVTSKRPAAKATSRVLGKQSSSKPSARGSTSKRTVRRPVKKSKAKQTSKSSERVAGVWDKLEKIQDLQGCECEDLRPHVQELVQLYRDAIARGFFRKGKDRFAVLRCAMRLANMAPNEGTYGAFLGRPLIQEILNQGPLNLNHIDKRSGRSELLSACVGGSDESGIWLNWDAICVLASTAQFACLDLTAHLSGDFHIQHGSSCLTEDVLLSLIERNRAHPDPRVRATVNWAGDGLSLLHLVCGARADPLRDKDYAGIDEYFRQRDRDSPMDGEAIMAMFKNASVFEHFQGSAAVVKALLEHPDFTRVNFTTEEDFFRSGCSALHMIVSTSGECRRTSMSDYSGPELGYHSFRHLSWDTKLAALEVFLEHAEANPGKIDFRLRCKFDVFVNSRTETKALLPVELARQVGFPLDLIHRMEAVTLPGVPSEVVRRVGRCIVEYL